MTLDHVLVPIDGSDVGYRALSFGVDLAAAFDAELEAVYFTVEAGPDAEAVLERAERVLAAASADATLSLSTDLDLEFRPADRLGQDILELATERGTDHVVMGHAEPPGPVERVLLGSAAETILRSERVRLTVVP